MANHAQLRAFHHVALAGGFSRAAAALGQTQPALSEQVRRLEQSHDVLLFHREGRRIRLTAAGEALLTRTRAYFEAEEQIDTHLARARAAPSGRLRIMADSATHITAALTAFRARHPAVTLDITTGNSADVLAALARYEVELGVVGSFEPAPGLMTRHLTCAPIVAITAQSGPAGTHTALTLADLSRYPLIFREKGSRTRAALETAARAAGLRLTPAITAEGREAMRELVATGAGIGFISAAELGPDLRLRALPLSGPDLNMTETLVWLAARRDLPNLRAFLSAAGPPTPP